MYYLNINGQRTGPYSSAEIKNFYDQGAIGLETEYWKDGMYSWEKIGSSTQAFSISTRPVVSENVRTTNPMMYDRGNSYGQPMTYARPVMFRGPVNVGENKSRVAYILLGLFLGGLGIHNFYIGYIGKGVAQLLLTLLLFWTIVVPIAVFIWIIVEVISVDCDANGQILT